MWLLLNKGLTLFKSKINLTQPGRDLWALVSHLCSKGGNKSSTVSLRRVTPEARLCEPWILEDFWPMGKRPWKLSLERQVFPSGTDAIPPYFSDTERGAWHTLWGHFMSSRNDACLPSFPGGHSALRIGVTFPVCLEMSEKLEKQILSLDLELGLLSW